MKYLLSTFILITALNASAQFIFVPKKPIKTFHTVIDQYENTALTDSIPFSYIRIIDSRCDTTNIGISTDSYLALKDTSQPLGLQHTVDKYYHTLYMPGKDTLIIQLHKLSIEDNISISESTAYTYSYASCREYTGSNNKYTYYGALDTVIMETYSGAARFDLHKHGKHTNYEFWDYYLLRLCDAMITGPVTNNDSCANETNTYFTRQQIREDGLQKRNKPILTADTLKPGFYRNFDEFVNNNPTFLYTNDSVLPKLLKVMHYSFGKNTSYELPDTTYWGYCDGKNIYARYMYSYYQLERKDAAFYIAPTLDEIRRNSNREGWNLLIGLATLSASIAAKDGPLFDGFDAVHPRYVPQIIMPINGYNILCLRLDCDTKNFVY